MKLRDNLGWPVVTFRNRPVTNFLRRLIHTNIRQTWRLRDRKIEVVAVPNAGAASSPAEAG